MIQIIARIAYRLCPGAGAFEGRVFMLGLPRTPRQPGAADGVRACAPTTPTHSLGVATRTEAATRAHQTGPLDN
ncbi:MAG: hypothetical protein ACJ73S_26040 [Mycobacteriales bacterium]